MKHPKPSTYRRLIKMRLYEKPELYIEDIIPRAVVENQDGICGLCGKPLDEPYLADIDSALRYRYGYVIDHIIPFSLDGEHTLSNVQAVHPVCNRRKASLEHTLISAAKRWQGDFREVHLHWLEQALS